MGNKGSEGTSIIRLFMHLRDDFRKTDTCTTNREVSLDKR